jgi:hypothetical protein
MSFARCVAGEHLGLRSIEGGINRDTSPESAVFTLGARLGAPSAGTIGSRRRVCSIGPMEHQEVLPCGEWRLPRVPAKPRRS